MNDIYWSPASDRKKPITLGGLDLYPAASIYREREADYKHQHILLSMEAELQKASRELESCKFALATTTEEKKGLKRAAEAAVEQAIASLGRLNKRLKGESEEDIEDEDDGKGETEKRIESWELGSATL
jgi:hypothetical protein